jgi:hypothetical protein
MTGTIQSAIGRLVRVAAGASVMAAADVDVGSDRRAPVWPVIIAAFLFLIHYLGIMAQTPPG